MTNLNLYSPGEYMFFINSYNVKNSIIEILHTRFNCEIAKKMVDHFQYFDDKFLDNYSEFNVILPHKKLRFLTTKLEENKLDYTFNIKNNKIIPVNNLTKFSKKLKFYL